MSKQEFLTTEERERQKAARRRFREIVKQRWQEETLKNLSKKAFKKIPAGASLQLVPQPELITFVQNVGSSLHLRFSKGLWYLHFTFFSKKVESAAPTLTEAINGLIINKHLQNPQFKIQKYESKQ